MATVKIELELNWISEDGDLDSTIKDEVIKNLQSRFLEKIERSTKEMLNKKLEAAAARVTDEFLEGVLSNTINNLQIPYKENSWSSAVQMLSLSEYVGLQYDEYLKKKILDKDGNKARYSSDAQLSVHEYFINKYLEKELLGKVSDLIKTARADAENVVIKTLETNLKAQLSADLINRLNIPALLQNLQDKGAALLEGAPDA